MNPTSAAIEHRIREHVVTLAETIGERNVFRPRALATARDYIEAVFTQQGYQVARQPYEVHNTACANLQATLPGGAKREQVLLLGAHYDSVAGSPGADDNASGVAALLEIAGLFAATSPNLTVRLVAFVNEEPPFFMTPHQGSVVYAKAARQRGDDIRLMVSLEMPGCSAGFREFPGAIICRSGIKTTCGDGDRYGFPPLFLLPHRRRHAGKGEHAETVRGDGGALPLLRGDGLALLRGDGLG